ncbi:MAG: hypothetical protein GY773_14180 [Actinomycetia bacterium]|nr:hypothetical protein [Actinomycetes bacterium]
MFDNLTLRNKFLAIAAIPVNILVLLGLLAVAVLDQPLVAIVAGLGAVATLATTYVAGQQISDRVEALNDTVIRLGNDELPRIVAAMNDPDLETGNDADSGGREVADQQPTPEDELAALDRAIVDIGSKARSLLTDQETITNRRLSELVKNLARRHQSLLDHQIEHIDWLEDTEQSPPRLEQLFKLDHLATRLRRSAETVLVLAGGESTRPRGGPAPIATVLRVAMGETEAYTKINLRTIENVMIAGGPAFDLVHLLAEVLENATQFSPPETPVELHAIRLEDNRYQITVIDRGVGMDSDKIVSANELVSNPPDINLAVGRSIGFIVIGRLADRLGATVEIAKTPGSGVTATILVPANMVFEVPGDSAISEAGQTTSHEPSAPQGQAPPLTTPTGPAETWPPPSPAPQTSPEPVLEPAAENDQVRPRVTEDSSNALAKLLGISDNITELESSSDWEAPTVDGDKANPLTSRSTPKPMQIPPSLAGKAPAADREPAEPESQDDDVAASRPSIQPRRTPQPKPPVSGRPKHGAQPSRSLDEALPTGAAFDSGVEGLLATARDGSESVEAKPPVEETTSNAEGTWVPPTVTGTTDAALSRREKGASDIPTSNGPRARASTRKPEEIRSMITRYRDGLKGSVDKSVDGAAESAATEATGPEPIETASPEPGKED